MDNLTHSMAGWVLARAGLKRKTAMATSALILAANMPDIDVFLGLFGFENIKTHRGFTHGIGGIITMPPILALLLLGLYRLLHRYGKVSEDSPPMHLPWLIALCYLGAATHPMLDLMNTYGVQLLAPFSDRWFYGDTLFIIDLWIWLTLGFAIWLSRRREKRLKAENMAQTDWSWARPAQVAIAAVLVYIGANFALSTYVETLAEQKIEQKFAAKPDLVVASEVPIRFWARNIIWRNGTQLGRGSYNLFDSPGQVEIDDQTSDTGMDNPAIGIASREYQHISAFLYWSRIPMARVEREGDDMVVRFSDARYSSRSFLRRNAEEKDSDEDNFTRRVARIPVSRLDHAGQERRNASNDAEEQITQEAGSP